MRAGLQISKPSTPDMELAAIAVLPLGSGDHLDVCGRFKLAHAAHHLAQDRDLLVELILVLACW